MVVVVVKVDFGSCSIILYLLLAGSDNDVMDDTTILVAFDTLYLIHGLECTIENTG